MIANEKLEWSKYKRVQTATAYLPSGVLFRGYVIMSKRRGCFIARIPYRSDVLFPSRVDAKRHVRQVFESQLEDC